MKEPFKIGSTLKHISTGKLIILEKYDTQFVQMKSLIGKNRKANYNYLYGKEVDTNKSISGLSREFELY